MSLRKPLRPNDLMSTARGRNAVTRYMEAFAGDIRETRGIPAPVLEKERGPIVNRTDPSQLEGAVKLEVGKLLAIHPKVAFAERRNSGTLYNNAGQPVQFHKTLKPPGAVMRIPDFTGILKSGLPFAIETKHRGWQRNLMNEHEQAQARYMLMVQSLGGVAGFATCAENAMAILDLA